MLVFKMASPCATKMLGNWPRLLLKRTATLHSNRNIEQANRFYSDAKSTSSPEVLGFVKAQEVLNAAVLKKEANARKSTKQIAKSTKTQPENPKTFADLIKDCMLVQTGDITLAKVIGKIDQRVDDDLYIDYGGKFNCVCKVPRLLNVQENTKTHDGFDVGKLVELRIYDPEMTARFIGYTKDMTLLEADGRIVRLYDGNEKMYED